MPIVEGQCFTFCTHEGDFYGWILSRLDMAKGHRLDYPVPEWWLKCGEEQVRRGMMNEEYAESLDLSKADPIIIVTVPNPEAQAGFSQIIVDGNHRLLKAHYDGLLMLPCIVFDPLESLKAEMPRDVARALHLGDMQP